MFAKTYIRLCARVAKFVDYFSITLMAIMVLTVSWQVASRYLFKQPSVWTSELALLLFIWIVMLGSALAVLRHKHISVTILHVCFPGPVGTSIQIFADIVVLLCCVLLASTSYTYVLNSADAVSSGMIISLGWATSSMVVGSALMAMFCIASVLESFTDAGREKQ